MRYIKDSICILIKKLNIMRNKYYCTFRGTYKIFQPNNSINIITGFRADYYNVQNKIYSSPRVNLKYNPGDNTSLRFSAGRSFRIANVFADNMQHLVSSREVVIDDNIMPEIGWNYGFNFSNCFYFLNREGTLNIDLYRTVFENQVVVNLEDHHKLYFANLNGISYANVLQLDLDYNIIDNLKIRMSYKRNNSIVTLDGVEKEFPLQPLERGLLNLSHTSINDKWLFDCTLNYIGKSRLPYDVPGDDKFSPSFLLLNNQITYKAKSLDIYIGAENLTDYTQSNPIIDHENPFGDDFDASLIWGPVMGRTIYLGIRYNVN